MQVGVHKAPANAPLVWTQDVTVVVNDDVHGVLNPTGINVIRPLPGRGIRIFGTSLLGLFLIGVASGYTVAHLDEGRGFDLRTIAVIGVVLACLAGCGLLIRRDVRAFLAADSSIHGGGGEGERLYADQRKRFWTIIGGLAAIGAITGFVGSFVVVNDMLHIGASPR